MEIITLKKSVDQRDKVKEEKMVESNEDDHQRKSIKAVPLSTVERSSTGMAFEDSSSTRKSQEEELESTKSKMGKVREENERLKVLLSNIMKDYQSLETHFFDVLQQEEASKKLSSADTTPNVHQEHDNHRELDISLSLGRDNAIEPKIEDNKKNTTSSDVPESDNKDGRRGIKRSNEEVLALGLGFQAANGSSSKTESFQHENSLGESEEGNKELKEGWPPSKVLKTMRSNEDREEVVSQQNHLKKARVSIRARCDAPTMHDGCQWRKYGQKISKGNPCPRAYYRCTISPSCPVRKQVQRCQEDMSILITTYEGTHNHPLPLSATAMASTTSAAASMLQSQSTSSSTSPIPNSHHAGLINYSSTSNSHPTITLDLTTPNSLFTPHYNSKLPKHPSSSTSLSFSNTQLNFGAFSNIYSRNPHGALGFNGWNRQPTNVSPPFLSQPYASQDHRAETITKVITSNPNFRSAVAAALTSYVGGNGSQDHVPMPTSAGVRSLGLLPSNSSLQFSTSKGSSGSTPREDHVK